MNRPIRWSDYITFNAFWFALTARSQVLTPLIIPLLVQEFVGEEFKGAYLGVIRLWALMAAILMQALMGMLSDRSSSRWGRRRPFIFAGAIGEMIIYMLIGLGAGLSGMIGFWILFVLYTLSMASANTAHAAAQGIIPDLVPEEKRGLFSGVKSLFELPLPLIFVTFVVGKMIATGNMRGSLLTLGALMLMMTAITMFIPEKSLVGKPAPLDWQPLWRVFLMTAVFTVMILGVGQLVRWGVDWAVGFPARQANWIAGWIGLVGIVVTVGLGVWLSIRVSIGERAGENPSFTWWVINRLAFLVGSTNIAGFVIFYLQEKFTALAGEKAAGPAAQIVMFVGVFVLVTALPSGWLADRFGRKSLLVVSALMAASGAFFLVTAGSLTPIYIGGCLIGGGAGLFYTANWALGTLLVPKDEAGRFLGLSNLAGAGAGAVGAYIGGPIGDRFSYTLLMAVYGMLFLFSLLALVRIREPRAGAEVVLPLTG